jgi:L-rhamnose mutarotase
MERVLFWFRIYPGTEADYDRLHADVWPELVEEIRASGLRNMTGFRRGTDVWYYVECHPDAATAFAQHAVKPANRRWNQAFRSIVAADTGGPDDRFWFRLIFHAGDRGIDGPLTRALTLTVLDPDQIDVFDRRAGNPPAGVEEQLARAGFLDHSWFRLGALAARYGEYAPDLATVMGKIAQNKVGARWLNSLDEVRSLSSAARDRLNAAEIYHQD